MIKSVKYILTASFLYTCELYAQTLGVVKGVVKDNATNETLPGAVVVVDKTKGIAADVDGNYVLFIANGEHVIECDFVGYKKYTKSINVTTTDTLKFDISLETESGKNLLDEVVISAGKFEQKLSDITISMDVLKPAMLENKNAQTLDVIINQVSGVTVSDGQASIRGGSGYSYGAGSRVLMMVDEMPMISADAADIKWNYLPIENMEQVEVIKGAASALFGSSALNGVINMRTAYAKDVPQTTVSTFVGFYDAPRNAKYKWWKGNEQYQNGVNFAHSRKIGNLDVVLGGHFYNDEGYRYLENETRQRFNANLKYNFKNKLQGLAIGVNANMMQTDGGLFFLWQNADSAYIPQGKTIQKFDNQRFNIDPFITYYTKRGGKFSLRTRYFLTNNVNSTNQGSRAELYYNELQYQKRFKNNLTITTGAVYMEQQVIATSLYGRHSGYNYAGYAQFDYHYKKLTASAGMRGEYFKLDSSFTRGYLTKKINNLPFQPVLRAGLNYHLFEYTFLRASWGQGYRFPTIAEKFVSTSVSILKIFPNESLQPERGWSSEIGIKQGFKVFNFKGFLDVAYFWTEYKDMTEFVFDIYGTKTGQFYKDIAFAGFKSQNIGQARINGVDANITGAGKIGPVNVTTLIGYTYTNPKYLNFDPLKDTLGLPGVNVLKYRNRHLFKADVQLEYKKFAIGYSARYYSRMENIDRRFTQSVLHEYNLKNPDGTYIINWDEIPFTYVLPGLKEYREKHPKGDWISDARISYQIIKQIKLAFVVNNVFNAEYTLRPGDVRAPTTYMGQVVFKF